MAAGENAAEKLKGVFHQGSVSTHPPTVPSTASAILITNPQEATESARQNTNSFFDNLASGSKADTADTSAASGHQKAPTTTGGVDGEKTAIGGHEDAKGDTGFNKDAEAVGGAAVEGAENAAEKAKRKFYGT